jgi:hypothetical protein
MIFILPDLGRLPAPPPTPATTTTAASRPHARGTAAAAGARTRSVVALGTPGASSESIPVSATPARDVPAPDSICSASTGPVANACTTSPVTKTPSAGPIAHAGSPGAIARQIPALPANLLPGTSLAIG